MAWMLVNPEMQSIFAPLGVLSGDNYQVSNDCLSNLSKIMEKLVNEDRSLRTFRRAIGFGQNIKRDFIPLLIHVKNEDQIINQTIRILVNLTIPVECLLSTDAMLRTDVGYHTMYDLNRLLTTSKEAFCDSRATKAILDHIKKIADNSETTMNFNDCDSINNCLLLLRNVLHIPENPEFPMSGSGSVQNKILWNLFTQSIDKVVLHLIAHKHTLGRDGKQIEFWGVTLVQLIALMYKDQSIGTLHKLLNLWFEASLSESSEDNESNTSPLSNQRSVDSSPMLTSDPTSDSSDNGGQTNVKKERKPQNNSSASTKSNKTCESPQSPSSKSQSSDSVLNNGSISSQRTSSSMSEKFHPKGLTACMKNISDRLEKSNDKKSEVKSSNLSPKPIHKNLPKSPNPKSPDCISEVSDCGYGTQMEKESISTSSNDDDIPQVKPLHQKPHNNQKSRFKEKPRVIVLSTQDKKESRRKKLVKRSKTHIINMKGLLHHTPTNEDISNMLKEFTVDFLLKGYNTLVDDLYNQLLTQLSVKIDTSHFFWLLTYFLKFATHLELDLEHVHSVLSFNILSYLIYEGVNLSEQLQIAARQPGRDLNPFIQRTHLVITTIREFLQTLECYQKISHLSAEDKKYLQELKIKLATSKQFKSLFILLLRQFNPRLQNLQYLEDLVVTNHILMMLLDTMKDVDGINLPEHLQQFATVDMVYPYGLLLENFRNNGEYVNNCVFTMMHHVGGDMESVSVLFQPVILKAFSQIWETDFDLCDDWADLIEYVIQKFINMPRNSPLSSTELHHPMNDWTSRWTNCSKQNVYKIVAECMTAEHSYYFTSHPKSINSKMDINEETPSEHGFNQNSIHGNELMKKADLIYSKDSGKDVKELGVFKDLLIRDDCGKYLNDLQNLLVEVCFLKLKLIFPNMEVRRPKKFQEPLPFYYCVLKKSIPKVTWTTEETRVYETQPFVMLMQKLGIQLSSETGNVFPRIPVNWTPDVLFETALRLGPIDKNSLCFDIRYLEELRNENQRLQSMEIKMEDNLLDSEQHMTDAIQLPFTPIPALAVFPFATLVKPPPLQQINWLQKVSNLKINDKMSGTSKTAISIEIPPSFVTSSEQAPLIAIANSANAAEEPMDQNDDRDCVSPASTISPAPSPNVSNYTTIPSVPSKHEQDDISETMSVTSDLTRMCVSDEEESSKCPRNSSLL